MRSRSENREILPHSRKIDTEINSVDAEGPNVFLLLVVCQVGHQKSTQLALLGVWCEQRTVYHYRSSPLSETYASPSEGTELGAVITLAPITAQ